MALAAALAAASVASAHGDPSTHTLEADNLYPAVASRPSQSLELQLIGLLRAATARGYPVKIALVANADDLEDATMLERPQAYAEYLQRELESSTALSAPLLVIAPTGFGVSGRELRGGRLQRVPPAARWLPLRGLDVPPAADGDALARTASVALRRIAAAAGRPLPARVAPASYVATIPSRDSGLGIWFPIVLAVSLLLACLARLRVVEELPQRQRRDRLAAQIRPTSARETARTLRRAAAPAAGPQRDQAAGCSLSEPAVDDGAQPPPARAVQAPETRVARARSGQAQPVRVAPWSLRRCRERSRRRRSRPRRRAGTRPCRRLPSRRA